MSKTRQNLTEKLKSTISRQPMGAEEFWEDVEESLIAADVGVGATTEIVNEVRDAARREGVRDFDGFASLLQRTLASHMGSAAIPDPLEPGAPRAILIVGVNGTGKTTTIAKLAHQAKERGMSVLLAAADTFRAAAIEQLEAWGERVGVPVVKHERGADPAAVTYDALAAARSRGVDRVLVDTAGRLHTYVNLMEELKKVKRVAERESGAGVLTLLVMDATTGQNGIAQARLFDEALGLDGIVLTKLDGTAKGGIVVAIQRELSIPVAFVGVGEGMDDLHRFDPDQFAAALVGIEGSLGEER
ncbi:MAG: signal recognition particle-docking protein FtsY [Actinobacteria bacterium]|nr:MAG: signal recognition particle-docking protein FtsY [Actinomycetota bacterium]